MNLIVLVPAIALIIVAYYTLQAYIRSDIPRIGKPGLIGYISTLLQYTVDSENVLQEGFNKFQGRPFIIPTIAGSMVVIGPEHVETLRKSDDTIFSQSMALDEGLRLDYTLNKNQMGNPYQVKVVRTDVTRAIASFIPDVLEETGLAMKATFDPSDDSKPISLPVFKTFTYMIARISNRIMLGTDLCRNDDFVHAVVRFAETLVPYAQVLNLLPSVVRPVVYFILSSTFGGQKEPKKFIVPYFEKHLKDRQDLGEDGGPDNIAGFLIRHSAEDRAEDLAMRVLNLNFGSIHTSAIYLTQATFELSILSNSDLESIKREVQEALDTEGGWNKAALAKFRKIDSLLREIARFHGLALVGTGRWALQDTVLDDGTRIPAGQRVEVNLRATHFNPEIYPNPHVFDPFRFSRLREEEGNDAKYGFTTIDNNYLPFGTGRHACPGRFFAAMELKVIIAFLLLNYDFSLPPGITDRPQNLIFNTGVIPNIKAELVFKRKPCDL